MDMVGQATKKSRYSESLSFMRPPPPARDPVTRRVKHANAANPSQLPQHIVSQSVPNITSTEQGSAALQPSPNVVDQNSNVPNVSLGQHSLSQKFASPHTQIAADQQASNNHQPNMDQQNQPLNLDQLLMTPLNNHASDSSTYDEEVEWSDSELEQIFSDIERRYESGPSCMQPQVPGQQQSLTNSIAANPSHTPQHIVSRSVPNMTSREQGSAALQPSPDVVDRNSNMQNVSLGQQSLSQRFASPHTPIAADQQASNDQQPNMDQQNQPPDLQQLLMTQQNNLPIAQQQQLGSQSNDLGLWCMMPQSKVSLQQRPQQVGAPTRSQQFQRIKPPLHRVSGYLQKVVEQQNQSDRPPTEPASGFTDPTLHANGGDWQKEVYQKIQSIKARYLPALHQIHRNAVARLEKTATLTTQAYADQTKKIRRLDTKVQCYIKLLQFSKSDISPGLKEKWPLYEKHIIDCVNAYGPRKPIAVDMLHPSVKSRIAHSTTQAYADQTEKIRRLDTKVECYIKLLQFSKSDISPGLKEKWPLYEKYIIDCVNAYGPKKPIAVDMLHPSVKSRIAHSSMVPHQHQKKELEQKSVCCHLRPVTTATRSFKRQKIEAILPLLKEIKEINAQLFDTIVDIEDEITDPSAIAVSSKGTFVTFSTIPVTLSPRLKSHLSAHRLQIQTLRLLVPSSYPNCSPKLLDDVSADISNKDEDLRSKALRRFKLTLPTLSEPQSLKEIARTWEVCVLAVISEYAKQLGDSLLYLPR